MLYLKRSPIPAPEDFPPESLLNTELLAYLLRPSGLWFSPVPWESTVFVVLLNICVIVPPCLVIIDCCFSLRHCDFVEPTLLWFLSKLTLAILVSMSTNWIVAVAGVDSLLLLAWSLAGSSSDFYMTSCRCVSNCISSSSSSLSVDTEFSSSSFRSEMRSPSFSSSRSPSLP